MRVTSRVPFPEVGLDPLKGIKPVNVSVALPVSVRVIVSVSELFRKVMVTETVSALVPERFSSSSTSVTVALASVPMMYLILLNVSEVAGWIRYPPVSVMVVLLLKELAIVVASAMFNVPDPVCTRL